MQKTGKLLIGLLVLLLAGCAAKSVQRDYALDEKSGKGIVIVSVSHDQRGSRALNAIFYVDFKPGIIMPEHMMLKTLGESFPGIPKASEFKDNYGQVLALELPAGMHQINSWRASRSGGFQISPRDMPPPLEFEVVAGKIQYLGNLHLILEGGRNIFGIPIVSDAHPEVRDMRQRDIAMIERKYPQFKEHIDIALLPLGLWPEEHDTSSTVLPIYIPVPIKK
ncbi:hypothetical protein PMI16_02876 [Herbaspirillum sp. CF444]|uniref:hypothetical protein n=1 Tax=Herbaspirillum sp. CF444 TaxID=1144319 RepID=UPI00027283F8|nr:hypothetical protein [Herbaspirillum sp. CF444]EJL87532.1 hypothetical protein PMI16_02876 [Herbaspirillum sp. CF444]